MRHYGMKLGLFLPLAIGAQSATAQTASWSPVFSLPLNAIHTSLLPSGKVLMWGRIEENDIPIVWDPATKTYITVPTPSANIFCSGHNFLSDGSLIVAGGHLGNDIGTKDLLAFDCYRNVWKRLPDMKYDRWYPGALTISTGQVFIAAGTYTDPNGTVKGRLYPELYDPETNTIKEVTNAYHMGFWYYPNMYNTSDCKIFMNRPVVGYRKIDPSSSTDTWHGADPAGFSFYQFSFARYLPSKVLSVSSVTLSDVKTIGRFDANSYTWTQLPSSVGGRRDCDTTILADGKVLISGGSNFYAEPSTATLATEVYDPVTDTITQGPSETIPRVYHSSAVLLPDGSVLKVGSGAGGSPNNVRQKNGEIYYPWYYSNPTRPVITSAPNIVAYGLSNSITVSSVKPLTGAALIRLGSATHGLNYSQVYVPLPLGDTSTPTVKTLVVPASRGDIPPGPYMLVVKNSDGVPSVAKMITVGNDMAKPSLTNYTDVLGTISGVTSDSIAVQDNAVAVVKVPVNTKNLDVASGEFEFLSPRKFVSSLRVRTSTRWLMGGNVKVEAWNCVDGAWETLGASQAGYSGSSTMITQYFERRLNAREYINQTTKKVRIRLTFTTPGSVMPLSNAELDVLSLYFTY